MAASIRIWFTSRTTDASCAAFAISLSSVSSSVKKLDVLFLESWLPVGQKCRDGVTTDAGVLFDEPGNFPRRSQYTGMNVQAGQRLKFVDGGRRRTGSPMATTRCPVVPGDRHEVLAVNDFCGMASSTSFFDGGVRKVDLFQAELLGQDRQQDFFFDEAFVDEYLVRRKFRCGLDGVGGAGTARIRRAVRER